MKLQSRVLAARLRKHNRHFFNKDKLGFFLTPGNTSDLAILPSLAKGLFGKLFGDKRYISQELFEKLFAQGVELITKLRANMKNKLLNVIDKILSRKRGVIDSVIGKLKPGCQIEH